MGMLIGNSVLKRLYTIFDAGNNRIGLTEAIRSDVSYKNLTVPDSVVELQNLRTNAASILSSQLILCILFL